MASQWCQRTRESLRLERACTPRGSSRSWWPCCRSPRPRAPWLTPRRNPSGRRRAAAARRSPAACPAPRVMTPPGAVCTMLSPVHASSSFRDLRFSGWASPAESVPRQRNHWPVHGTAWDVWEGSIQYILQHACAWGEQGSTSTMRPPDVRPPCRRVGNRSRAPA